MNHCYWVFEDELRCFIPGCIGGAVSGPEGCTCDVPLSEVEQVRQERNEALAYVDILLEKAERRREYIDCIICTQRRLRDEIQKLRDAADKITSSPTAI